MHDDVIQIFLRDVTLHHAQSSLVAHLVLLTQWLLLLLNEERSQLSGQIAKCVPTAAAALPNKPPFRTNLKQPRLARRCLPSAAAPLPTPLARRAILVAVEPVHVAPCEFLAAQVACLGILGNAEVWAVQRVALVARTV